MSIAFSAEICVGSEGCTSCDQPPQWQMLLQCPSCTSEASESVTGELHWLQPNLLGYA